MHGPVVSSVITALKASVSAAEVEEAEEQGDLIFNSY